MSAMSDHPSVWEDPETERKRLEAERDLREQKAEEEAQWVPAEPPKPKRGLVTYEFDDPEAKIGKDYVCKACGAKAKIEERHVWNAGSGVVSTAPHYQKYAEAVENYPQKYAGNYVQYRWDTLKPIHAMSAIPYSSLGMHTSITLPCGHTLGVTVEYAGKQVQEPKPIDALVELGVHGKENPLWLSYIYQGQVSQKYGERKAEEITKIVNAYKTEMAAFEKLESQLRELVPVSITGRDSRMFSNLKSEIQAMENELKEILKTIVEEIDETLVRLARRPGGKLPDRSWVAVGDA